MTACLGMTIFFPAWMEGMIPSLSRAYIFGLLMPTMAAASVTDNVILVHG